jgi:hypothetical protein
MLIIIIVIASFFITMFGSITQKVVNADSIISNYEWYYDMYGQIQATEKKYDIAKKSGKEEADGIRMVLEGMIQEYNSKSKQVTRNLWKAKDLPYQIEYKEDDK